MNDEENDPININLGDELGKKAERSLVGKIVSNQTIGKEVVQRTMESI